MPSDDKRRQKALQRKAAKHKERQKRKHQDWSSVAPAGASGVPRAAADWPLYECLVTRDWTKEGELVQVLVARRAPGGPIAAAAFVVDLGCLGVKSALSHLFHSPAEYEVLRRRLEENQTLVGADLNLAAKIIREGVAYARQLGFQPERDYPKAAILLADADPEACDKPIPLGKDGKPFFFAGPYDDPERVVKQLTRAVGEGNFHYVVFLGAPPDWGDEDDEE